MNDLPLLTIIVPIFNVELYLKKCIKSIINQTYKNLEIILVNDGSTDEGAEICNEFSKMDERITVIHKENGGLSEARNFGLDISNGEYIGFVDGDDWIELGMYESLMLYTLKYKSDITECNVNFIYDNYIKKDSFKNLVILKDKETIENFLDRSIDIKGNVWSKVYKRNIIENIRFPIGKLHEDAYFTYKALYLSEKYLRIAYNGYNYLQNRDGSIMSGETNKKNILHVLEAFEERNIFFANKENILYQKSEAYYFRTLLSYLIISKNKINKDYEIISILESKIKSNKKNIFLNKYLSIKKIKFLVYFIVPKLLFSFYSHNSKNNK